MFQSLLKVFFWFELVFSTNCVKSNCCQFWQIFIKPSKNAIQISTGRFKSTKKKCNRHSGNEPLETLFLWSLRKRKRRLRKQKLFSKKSQKEMDQEGEGMKKLRHLVIFENWRLLYCQFTITFCIRGSI